MVLVSDHRLITLFIACILRPLVGQNLRHFGGAGSDAQAEADPQLRLRL